MGYWGTGGELSLLCLYTYHTGYGETVVSPLVTEESLMETLLVISHQAAVDAPRIAFYFCPPW